MAVVGLLADGLVDFQGQPPIQLLEKGTIIRLLVRITMGVCIMTWKEAKREIEKHVVMDTDINTFKKDGTQRSHGRKVICICECGYTIPKGEGFYMFVTWNMLEICWNGMVDNGGKYDHTVFKDIYPEYKNSGCYVQTIHMIFKKAGLT